MHDATRIPFYIIEILYIIVTLGFLILWEVSGKGGYYGKL